MANIDRAMVKKLASLCKIACSESQEEKLMHDLQKIVAYVDQLDEIATEQVDPCRYVIEALAKTPLRDDKVLNSLDTNTFLALTPKHTSRMVRVFQVLKDS